MTDSDNVNLSTLVCGNTVPDGDLSSIMRNISWPIDEYFVRVAEYIIEEDSKDIALLGPFCGRALLEISLTALLGRIDPFRIFVVNKSQSSPDYKMGQRNYSAITWAEDIFAAEEKLKQEKESPVWGASLKIEKISRALFSPHVDDVYWRPATTRCIDFLSDRNRPSLLDNITSDDPAKFIHATKGKASQVYSALSKGIHVEFVIPMAAKFDAQTTKEYLRSVLEIVVSLSVVSHFIETAQLRLDQEQLIDIVEKIQGKING